MISCAIGNMPAMRKTVKILFVFHLPRKLFWRSASQKTDLSLCCFETYYFFLEMSVCLCCFETFVFFLSPKWLLVCVVCIFLYKMFDCSCRFETYKYSIFTIFVSVSCLLPCLIICPPQICVWSNQYHKQSQCNIADGE